jgi:hypothetical protein
MVVLTVGIMPNLKDHRAEVSARPTDCAELLWIVILLVNHVHLIKDLLRFFEADTMFLFDSPALCRIEFNAQRI